MAQRRFRGKEGTIELSRSPFLHVGSIAGTLSLTNVEAVVVLDEAAEDLVTGRAFYDSREQGIGDYFIDSLLSDIDSLQIFAGIHSVHFGFHRMLSRRFPFAVYYDIDQNIARVAAVLDMRRDPAWIRTELEERIH